MSGNLYDLFIYPVEDIAPHVLNKYYGQVLNLNNIEYIDLLDHINVPDLVELSIRFKLDLVDEKYGILI